MGKFIITEDEKNHILNMYLSIVNGNNLNEQSNQVSNFKPQLYTVNQTNKPLETSTTYNVTPTCPPGKVCVPYNPNPNQIEEMMEGFREFLTSNTGTVVQVLLAFTQVGVVANIVAWAIVTLYDAYLYFFQNRKNKLVDLIIDLICLAGSSFGLSSVSNSMKGFFGKAASSIEEVLVWLSKQKIYTSVIEPVLTRFASGMTRFTELIDQGVQWLIKNTKIDFAKVAASVKNFITNISEKITNLRTGIQNISSGAASKILSNETANIALRKFVGTLSSDIANITDQELAKVIGAGVDKSIMKASISYAEDSRNKTIADVLGVIDSKLGIPAKEAFLTYIYFKKFNKVLGPKEKKETEKIVEKIGSNLLKFDYSDTQKRINYSNKLGKSVAGTIGA
jgi:hypothetical protein